MNGITRYFKLYIGDLKFRWTGFAGYTLKDLLTTDVATNTMDGIFYEHNKDETYDLWSIFQTPRNDTNATNSTDSGSPTVTLISLPG